MLIQKLHRNGIIIDAKGKHIYPGFIAPNSTLGLVEIDAVRATNDDDEVGAMNPHIRSIIAYNTESKVVESMRPNGVLMAKLHLVVDVFLEPHLLYNLMLGTGKMLAIKTMMVFTLNWPSTYSRGRWWLGEPSFKTKQKLH